jgi:hypothetical protein
MLYLVSSMIRATGILTQDKIKGCVILGDIKLFPGDTISSR